MEFHYEGVKEGYPKLRKRFGKIVDYVQLCRPFTLFAPFLAGFLGVLVPLKEVSINHLVTAVYVGITLALAQACGQCLNQYADVDLDKLIKPYRCLPSGRISKEEALGVSWLLAIFSVGRAFTISTFFGLIVLTLLFFAVFYSLVPFSPRRIHPLVNTGWMALSRGFLPMFAVWSVYGSPDRAWPYSILAFLWVMGFQASKDVPDVEGDRKFGVKTIPNTYGLRGLVATMVVCSIFYTVLSVYFKVYIMLLLVPLAILAVLTLKRQTEFIENTYAWGCFYIGLGILYILMFISERM